MSSINEQQKVIEIDINPFDDIELSAQLLAKEIASLLKEEVEELNVFSHVFRTSLERSIKRILWDTKRNMLPINIYPEAIPGFTLFLVRKQIEGKEFKELSDENQKEPPVDKIGSNPFRNKEEDIVKSVMNNFFAKNEGKVVWIEYENLLMMLFHVSDTRENIRRMELYITE